MSSLDYRPQPTDTPRARAVPRDLIDLVLRPYLPGCRYLERAAVTLEAAALTLRGSFSIASSCYIDSTGHFNAVEANICVNQLGYLLFAWFSANAEDHEFRPAVGPFDLQAFRDKQLPSMWILSLQTSFRRAIDPRSFEGTLTWTRATRKRPDLLLLNMEFRFTDGADGLAEGSVLLALT